MLEEFVCFAAEKGIRRRPVYIHISQKLILRQLYSYIARNILGDEAFYKTFLEDDNTLHKAVTVLREGNAFPTVQTSEENEE